MPLILCVLLLSGAGPAAWFVPVTESEQRAWASAVPCSAEAPSRDCLTTLPAVISRTEVGSGKERSWLYFAEGRPQERLSVSQEGAKGFRSGERVELTLWRGQVREVTGQHHVLREHFVTGREVAVIAYWTESSHPTATRPGCCVVPNRRTGVPSRAGPPGRPPATPSTDWAGLRARC